MRHGTRAVIALVIAGAVIRLWGLGAKSLWADEGASWALAVEGAPTYEHPPLYLWLLGGSVSLCGTREWCLRLPSVAAGCALIPVVYLLGLRLARRREALIAGAAAAASPLLLMSSQEARMYSLASLLGAVLVLAFLELRKRPGPGWRILWVASAWALVATHHVGWLLVVPQIAWLLLRRSPGSRRDALLLGAALLLLYAPVIPRTVQQVAARLRQPSGGLLSAGPWAVVRMAGVLYRMGAGYALPPGRPWIIAGGVPLLLAAYGAVCAVRESRSVGILAVWLLPAAAFVAVEGSPANVAGQSVGAFLLLLGIGISRTGRLKPICLLAVAGVWVGAFAAYHGAAGYPLHPEDWRSLARHLEAHCGEDEVIYLTGSRNSYFAFDYYYQGKASFVCRVAPQKLFEHEARPLGVSPGVGTAVETLLRDHSAVWLVYVDWGLPAVAREVRELDDSWLQWEDSFGQGLRLKRYAAS
jgi:4-amino-4-deoxy-L-arabinose transferase-like glycosyltransferase